MSIHKKNIKLLEQFEKKLKREDNKSDKKKTKGDTGKSSPVK